ncbi:MAG: Uma2 family endonuclease [Armatimonadota bacterium]
MRLLKRRFTVDEYYRMAGAGIFTEDDRVELIDGEIVEMVPIGSRHAACVMRLTRLLSAVVGARAIVGVQNPVRLDVHSEPQPDVAVLRPRPDFYARGHPGPEDSPLIIEVADSSVVADREIKVPLYAKAAIPEVWVIDLQGGTIDQFQQPSAQGYLIRRARSRGEGISPEALPELSLAVDEILG